MAAGRVARLGRIDGIGPFNLCHDDVTMPGPGEILVRIEACSLNYHDYIVVTDRLGPRDGVCPLSDAAGYVEAVGSDVTTLSVGERVVSQFFPLWASGTVTADVLAIIPGDRGEGFARDYITVPENWFVRAPCNLTAMEAATLPCAALTAWRALMIEARIRPGDWVVTQGTGGVSLFALQFAKAAGARVIATSSSDEKLTRLRDMGADVLVNYRNTPDWSSQVLDATDSLGADEIVEIGGPQTLDQSIKACRTGGHISLIGVLTGVKGEIATAELMRRNIRLRGITVGSRSDQIDMTRAIEANGIKPVLDKTFTLEKLVDAFEYQASGRHFGKIGIDIKAEQSE